MWKKYALLFLTAIVPCHAWTENLLVYEPLEAFRPVKGWHGVADVAAVADQNVLEEKGNGSIVLNGTKKDLSIPFLITKAEYGDVKVELEFKIPHGSNAGVYLMGRYEVQILDSFGRARVGSGDLGGIYQRFDRSRGKGKEGYEGTAPAANAAKAPGQWQSMEIIFRAPRFDQDGKKVKDALFEKVFVNGTLVQQNATTTGPTQSSAFEDEVARGPIAIQGDHGPIAIRTFRVTSLDANEQKRIAELDAYWAKVSRAVNEGDFASYQETCHPEGVLVSGNKRTAQPLADALKRWKTDFESTREGKITASVEFRFSRRIGDATTAHESGIFRYESQVPGAEPKVEYVKFEGLLNKTQEAWKILMENQQSSVSELEWQRLK